MMEDICYKKNYITEAIARIDFLNPIKKINNDLSIKFIERIKEHFPIAESKEITKRNVHFKEAEIVTSEIKIIEWTFWNKARNRKILLLEDHLSLLQIEYNTYEDFFEEFKMILEALSEINQDVGFKRFGMRYVNTIRLTEGNPLDWHKYIIKDLIASINIPKDKKNISRTFHTLELNYEEFKMRFNFGIHNPDYPASVKKRIFILDMDVYNVGIQNKEDIILSFPNFHMKIQEFFEYSITDKFRKILNNE